MNEPASLSQLRFLSDLILRHPNFKKTLGYDNIHHSGERIYIKRDGVILGERTHLQAQWLMLRYFQWLPDPVENLEEIDKSIVSALISHLQLSEQERLTKKEKL